MTVMIALVGEQPQPNLISALHLKPGAVLLIYTAFTKAAHDRQAVLLKQAGITVDSLKCDNEFDAVAVRAQILRKLDELAGTDRYIFNVTGGTKAMVLAAAECCRDTNSRLVYLETARNKSRLYAYHYDQHGHLVLQQADEIPPVLSIRQFLDAQLGKGNWRECGYSKDVGGVFEQAVGEALQSSVDEIVAGVRFLGEESGRRPQVDLDIVLRVGNQFGIVEVKDRDKVTLDAIKQLHYLSTLLGTYTAKFWVLSRPRSPEHQAVIDVTRTTVIELESFQSGELSETDKNSLVAAVLGRFS